MNEISNFLGQPWWQGVSVVLAVAGLILAFNSASKKEAWLPDPISGVRILVYSLIYKDRILSDL